MKLGITGTRHGTTREQRATFCRLVAEWKPSEIHHGDCFGADAEIQAIAIKRKIPTISHPPENISKRAFTTGNREVRKVKSYLVRNANIVMEVDVLMAFPETFKEELRSGTWATIREARRVQKPVIVIWPNGKRLDDAEWRRNKTPVFLSRRLLKGE